MLGEEKLNQGGDTLAEIERQFKYENKALAIAEKIHTTCPIIYGSEELTWVAALRFRGQLAENAKMLSFHNNFPEQNHNEIEGLSNNNSLSLIWLLDKNDHIQVKKRIKISKLILEDIGIRNYIIEMEGEIFFERFLKFIIFTDWISFYLAIINRNDPSPVHKISKLKSMLK